MKELLNGTYQNLTSRYSGNVYVEFDSENSENLNDGVNLAIYYRNEILVNLVIPKKDIVELACEIIRGELNG